MEKCVMLDPLLYSDELEEAHLIDLRLMLIEKSIMTYKTDCWIWQGGQSGNGYGQIYWPSSDRKCESAHRVSWIAFNGPITDGLWVLHKCNNKLCVRPDHLYLGTPQDNVDDREAHIAKVMLKLKARETRSFLRRF